MKNISKRMLNFGLFIAFFIGIFILTYTFLTHGIKIHSFNIVGIEIKEFYLRLDKKFILEVDSIDLQNINKGKDSKDFTIQSQLQYAKNIHSILQFFENIKIHSIKYEDYNANLFFDGENFTINLPKFYAKLSLEEQRSFVLINIEQLYFKDYGLLFSGNGDYNIKKQWISLKGQLNFLDKKDYHNYAKINLNLTSDLKNITLNGNSSVFSDIKFLKEIIPNFKNPLVEAWIFDNYKVSSAKINDFFVNIPLKSKNLLEETLDSLKIQGEAKDAEVYFHPDLSPTKSEFVKIVFQNNSLEFYPTKPTYNKHILSGSSVILENITKPKTAKVNISLKTNTKLDDDILKILNVYNINLPVKIPDSKIDSTLFIGIALNDLIIKYHGFFSGKNTKILLNNIPINSQNIEVKLDNHIIDIITKNTTYNDILHTDSEFIIDTSVKQIAGDLDIFSLNLSKDSKEVFFMQNHSLPFSVDFSDEKVINFTLPTLEFSSLLKDNNYTFKLSNLTTLIPFSQILQNYKVFRGGMEVFTSDFSNYNAKIFLDSNQEFLLEKDNKAIKSIALNLVYNPQLLSLKSSDERISYFQYKDKNELLLKNVNLLINPDNQPNASNKPFFIKAKDSNLVFKNKTLLADSYQITLDNDETHLQLRHKNGLGNIYKKGNFINIDAKEFGDTFINTLFAKEAVKNGRFFINASTNHKGVLLGQIKAQNTSLNQIHLLQNMMAFIDTIPSLLSFKVPGFNNEGYYLQNGVIDFGLNEKYFAINTLNFQGSSIDIKGDGIYFLKEDKIDFRAQLITAKALSSIINKIPVVNFILLGKDGTISTGFKIEGSLENPKITTQTTQDFLLAPFNILKRTITSPIEIFN